MARAGVGNVAHFADFSLDEGALLRFYLYSEEEKHCQCLVRAATSVGGLQLSMSHITVTHQLQFGWCSTTDPCSSYKIFLKGVLWAVFIANFVVKSIKETLRDCADM